MNGLVDFVIIDDTIHNSIVKLYKGIFTVEQQRKICEMPRHDYIEFEFEAVVRRVLRNTALSVKCKERYQ